MDTLSLGYLVIVFCIGVPVLFRYFFYFFLVKLFYAGTSMQGNAWAAALLLLFVGNFESWKCKS